MLRIATALSALGLLISPVAASAKDEDCKSDSRAKQLGTTAKLRFEVNINNKTTRTLTADFSKTLNGTVTTYPQQTVPPGQKASLTDDVKGGGTAQVETKLASRDGALTFGSTYFSVSKNKNSNGDYKTRFRAGPFDAKITCDRNWNSNTTRWVVDYVVNP